MIRISICIIWFVFGAIDLAIAQSFELLCNKKTVQIHEQNDVPLSYGLNTYKFARVTYQGNPLKLEVAAHGFTVGHDDWDISPHSYGIKGVIKDGKLSFVIDRVGYVVLRFSKDQDFTKRLVIFVEAPDKLPKGELVDIVENYRVDHTGTQNETEKIQQALDEISGSGKVLYFPAGTYKTFMIQIKSDSRIHLDKNARIKADASEFDAYLARDGIGINRFILIKNAQNIHVTGLGTFDGNGSEILGIKAGEDKTARWYAPSIDAPRQKYLF